MGAQHRRALAVVTNEKRARVELQGQLEHEGRARADLQRKLEREARAKVEARRRLEQERRARQQAEADNEALSSQLSKARAQARRWHESEDELEDLREANAVLAGMVDGLLGDDDEEWGEDET